MDRSTYCTQVCRGKCCTLQLPDEGPVRCPRQCSDGSCSVYKERYKPGNPRLMVVGYWESRRYKDLSGKAAVRPFFCGHIEDLIARGALPKEVADGCCYVHEELLEEEQHEIQLQP